MDRVRGFAWPLPRAFAGPASSCRFEQGDVLYDAPSGYAPWTPSSAGPTTTIQVIDPPRTTRAAGGDADGNRFQVNWGLPVTVDVHTPDTDHPTRLATTQGRLFVCLWRGDRAWLDDAVPLPDPPLGLRELHRRLPEAVPAFVSRLRAALPGDGRSLFLAAVDDASEASRVKTNAIEALLEDAFTVRACTLTPAEAGLEEADRLHPALGIRGVAIARGDAEAIGRTLAGMLYGGADEGGGRFSLSRHGHLAALDEA